MKYRKKRIKNSKKRSDFAIANRIIELNQKLEGLQSLAFQQSRDTGLTETVSF